MEKKKMFDIIGISCAGVGFLLTFIFTFISCNSSAKKAVKLDYDGSLLYIVVAAGAVLAIAGAVFAFLAYEKGQKPTIFAIITLGLVVVTLLFAIVPHVTICAYNCSMEDHMKDSLGGLSSYFN